MVYCNPMLIRGLEEIGAYMGVSAQTIRRWVRRESFPAAQLPAGAYLTSEALIDRWLEARALAGIKAHKFRGYERAKNHTTGEPTAAE